MQLSFVLAIASLAAPAFAFSFANITSGTPMLIRSLIVGADRFVQPLAARSATPHLTLRALSARRRLVSRERIGRFKYSLSFCIHLQVPHLSATEQHPWRSEPSPQRLLVS